MKTKTRLAIGGSLLALGLGCLGAAGLVAKDIIQDVQQPEKHDQEQDSDRAR